MLFCGGLCSLTCFPCTRRYLRALAVMYIRMTFRAVDVYEMLEPLLKDYRKLRVRNMGACRSLFRSPTVSPFFPCFLGQVGTC